MYRNEFNAVGRLVVAYARNGRWFYVMYVNNCRIEFSAPFSAMEDVALMDYIEVHGYVNGRMKQNDDGTVRHAQGYTATSITKANPELTEVFDVPGNAATTFFNVFLAGEVDRRVAVDRYDIRIVPSAELHRRNPLLVRINISSEKFPEFSGTPGAQVYIYAQTITKEAPSDGRPIYYQHLNAVDVYSEVIY